MAEAVLGSRGRTYSEGNSIEDTQMRGVFMSIGERWMQNYFEKYREKWFAKGECTLHPYLDLLSKGQKNIKMITGELDPDLYNRRDVADKLEELLKDGVKIDFVFHKDDDRKKAIEDLIENNNKIIKLKNQYPENVTLYWQEKRARVHFTIVDGKHIMLEELHGPHEPRGVLIKYKTALLAQNWAKRYEDIKEGLKEIKESELEKN